MKKYITHLEDEKFYESSEYLHARTHPLIWDLEAPWLATACWDTVAS